MSGGLGLKIVSLGSDFAELPFQRLAQLAILAVGQTQDYLGNVPREVR